MGGRDEEEGPFFVGMVQADSPDEARVRAQHELGEMMRRAHLKVRQADVVWVAPATSSDGDDLRFLDLARDLLDDERPEMAVLAAQTHLETQVSALVARVVAKAPSGLRDEVYARQRNWSMISWQQQLLVEDTLGVRPSEWRDWGRYCAHLRRRNEIAHRGQRVDDADALDSVAVVEALWLWLNDAASRRWTSSA